MHNLQNNKICFSHRPVAGVSVGAYAENGIIYIAASFVNDGFSRNGIFYKERSDTFSRPVARSIIAGRLNAAREAYVKNGDLTQRNFVAAFRSDMSAGEFMGRFRTVFKPDPHENDVTFMSNWREDGGIAVPYIWNKIDKMANQSVCG